MMTVPTFAEKLAVRLLAREGISAVWQLHVAAATAYRDGYKRAAETVLEIADAAERELLERAHPLLLKSRRAAVGGRGFPECSSG